MRGPRRIPLRISYETEAFPAGTIPNCSSDLLTSWDEILHAAVTVGRPNRHAVLRHGIASLYEAIFRSSLIRMSLEQRGPTGARLYRTMAARTLDPTEKGAVNYFQGMTFCKLFAHKCLRTPWLLHLDLYRPALNAILTGRSRPDLIGNEHGTARWIAFECKGRATQPNAETKRKAKAQAQRLISVDGNPCFLQIGAITYYKNDVLQFYWRDPLPTERNKVDVPFTPSDWRAYYVPVLQMAMNAERRPSMEVGIGTLFAVEGLDIELGIHPIVARYLLREDWAGAKRAAVEATDQISADGYELDGLLVKSGESWRQRFDEGEFGEG